jgi:hypothetical protein
MILPVLIVYVVGSHVMSLDLSTILAIIAGLVAGGAWTALSMVPRLEERVHALTTRVDELERHVDNLRLAKLDSDKAKRG